MEPKLVSLAYKHNPVALLFSPLTHEEAVNFDFTINQLTPGRLISFVSYLVGVRTPGRIAWSY